MNKVIRNKTKAEFSESESGLLHKTIAVIILSLFLFSLSYAEKPFWITDYPYDADFYVGIGFSSKNTENYIQEAKNNAINEIASQIKITISSETIHKLIEENGRIDELLKQQINTSTKESLEDVEVVDNWDSGDEYWVYCRLSKEKYKKQKQLRLKEAVNKSLNLFSKAKESEKRYAISKALSFYFESLKPIEKYLNEPLQVKYNNQNIYLLNEIYSSIQDILNNISLFPEIDKFNTKMGNPITEPIIIKANYGSLNKVKISNLPINFSFIRGEGDIDLKAKTDNSGRAICRIHKITAQDKIQIVKGEFDILSLNPEYNSSPVIVAILESFKIPNTKIIINVEGLSVFIRSEETNLGKKLDFPYIEPVLKDNLTNYGFSYVDDVSSADIMIRITAETRQGSRIEEMCSAFADVSISVVNMKNGEEIYKDAIFDVKGFQLNFNKAGLNALKKAADKINEEILPKLIEKINL